MVKKTAKKLSTRILCVKGFYFSYAANAWYIYN